MKVIVVILVLVACVATDDEWNVRNSEEIKRIQNDCLKQFPPTTEQMAKMISFEFPNEPQIRQYLLCTAEKMGIFSSHEGYHADRMGKQFKMEGVEEAEVEKLAADCIAKFPKANKSNDVAAYEVHKCLKSTTFGEKVQNEVKKHLEAAKNSS